jgi:hypothetical protein
MIAIVAVGGSGYAAFTKYSELQQVKQDLADKEDKKKELTTLAEERGREFELLKQKRDNAIAKIQVLLMLDPPDRLLWAEKLNMIADLRPDGVAVTEMDLNEEVQLVETLESLEARQNYKKIPANQRQGAKEPAPKKVPIIKQTFRVTGVAFEPQQSDRLTHITNFYDALREYYRKDTTDSSLRRFMDGFNQDPPSYGDFRDIEDYLGTGRRVTEFTITIETKPFGQQTGAQLLKQMNEDLMRRREQAQNTGQFRRRPAGGGSGTVPNGAGLAGFTPTEAP